MDFATNAEVRYHCLQQERWRMVFGRIPAQALFAQPIYLGKILE